MDYQTLNLLIRCSKEFNHQKIRMQDLSETEVMISSYIYLHDACSQDDVSIALKIDKTTIGKALLSLEKKACVNRSIDENDKRIKRLSLTELGRNKVGNLLDIHNNWLTNVMSCLNKEEQEQFKNYCDRLLLEAEKLENNK